MPFNNKIPSSTVKILDNFKSGINLVNSPLVTVSGFVAILNNLNFTKD